MQPHRRHCRNEFLPSSLLPLLQSFSILFSSTLAVLLYNLVCASHLTVFLLDSYQHAIPYLTINEPFVPDSASLIISPQSHRVSCDYQSIRGLKSLSAPQRQHSLTIKASISHSLNLCGSYSRSLNYTSKVKLCPSDGNVTITIRSRCRTPSTTGSSICLG